MNKKGYFFVMDALIAMLILGAGFLLITSVISESPKVGNTHRIAEDMLNVMTSVSVEEMCDDSADPVTCSNSVLQSNYAKILDKDYNMLELLGLAYYYKVEKNIPVWLTTAGSLIESLFVENGLIDVEKYGFSFTIKGEADTIIFANFGETPESYYYTNFDNLGSDEKFNDMNSNIAKSQLVVVSKKIILGNYFDPSVGSSSTPVMESWGPYVVEVKVWQK